MNSRSTHLPKALAALVLCVSVGGFLWYRSSSPEEVPEQDEPPVIRPSRSLDASFLLNLEPARVTLDGHEGFDFRHPSVCTARIRDLRIGFESRRTMQLARGAEVIFRSVLEKDDRLRFDVGFGLPQDPEKKPPAGEQSFQLQILARNASGKESLVWSRELVPPASEEERSWEPVECTLPYASGDLVFRCLGPDQSLVSPEAPGIANPRLVNASVSTRAAKHPPRNVIVFLVDTLRADHVGALGCTTGTTPALDALAPDSIVFTQANSAAPWTKASVASLMTSRYPSQHGAQGYPDRLPDSAITMAEVFSAAGYRTCAVGYNTWVFAPKFNMGSGFEEIFEVFDQSREGGARADAVVAEALDWIRRRQDKPFFLYIHAIDPHEPYVPSAEDRARFVAPYSGELTGRLVGPGKHAGRTKKNVSEEDLTFLRSLYDAEIAFTDRMLGALVERLRELNLWDETTFVFTADHGEEFLDHGSWSHGGSLYQEQLHVPLLLKPPASARIEAGRRDDPVSLIDVAPTLCELTHVSAGDAPFVGQSLLSFGSGTPRKSPVLAELHKDGQDQISVREGNLKYIAVFSPVAREELYDLGSDPGESQNLVSSTEEEQLDSLRRLVEVHRKVASRQGLYLEILADGQPVKVRIRVESPNPLLDYNLDGCERAGDELSSPSSESGKSIRATFVLEGKDRRDALILSPDSGEKLTLSLEVNGVPMPADHILLGPKGATGQATDLELLADDPGILQTSPPEEWQERPGVWCRIWQIRSEENVELDEEVLESLKALGYVE